MRTRTQAASTSSCPSLMHPIVLFDGVCKFCNGSVQFLIRKDAKDVFRFAPLQSEFAQTLLPVSMQNDSMLDTIILAEGGKLYTRSTAVLRICKHLGGGWSLLYIFIVVPKPVRDGVYRWIANRRYKLFGRYDSCMLPTEAVRRKFME